MYLIHGSCAEGLHFSALVTQSFHFQLELIFVVKLQINSATKMITVCEGIPITFNIGIHAGLSLFGKLS